MHVDCLSTLGTPPIEVLWTHNNCKVTLDTPGYNLHVTDGTHFLIIQQAKSAHSGEYLCEAYNEYGDTDSFCILNVKGMMLFWANIE